MTKVYRYFVHLTLNFTRSFAFMIFTAVHTQGCGTYRHVQRYTHIREVTGQHVRPHTHTHEALSEVGKGGEGVLAGLKGAVVD